MWGNTFTCMFLIAAPNYDKSCWFKEKATLNMDFPNVSGVKRKQKKKKDNNLYLGVDD